MDTTTTNEMKPGTRMFEAQIGDLNFEFKTIGFDDRKVTAAQLALSVGLHPIENYVVLAQTTAGELETLRPTETVDLGSGGVVRVFIVEGDRTYKFFVEGLSLEWPAKSLMAWQIKSVVNAADDQALVLEREGVDEVFEDDDTVSFAGDGAERFRLKKRKKTVTVSYGDRDFELERRIYTTEQLIVVFGVPAGYLLDFVGPNGEFREMAPGERIKIREGMEFASHPPVGQSS